MDLGLQLGVASGLGDFGDATEASPAWTVYVENEFLAPHISWQARLGRHVHEVPDGFESFADAAAPALGDFTGEFSVTELIIDTKIETTAEKKWQWFLLAGVGAYFWDLDLENDESFTETDASSTTTSGTSTTTTSGGTSTTTSTSTTSSSATGEEEGVESQGGSGTDLGFILGTGFQYMVNPEAGLGVEANYNYIIGDFDDSYWKLMAMAFFRF